MRLKLDRWAFDVYSNTLNILVGKATSFSFTFILIASLQVALNLIDLVYFTTDVRQKLTVRLLFFCKPLGVCFSFCLIIFGLKRSAKLIKTFCMLRKEKQREGKITFLENCSLKSIFLKSSKVQIKYHKKYAKSLNITRDGVQFWYNSWAWLRKTNKQKFFSYYSWISEILTETQLERALLGVYFGFWIDTSTLKQPRVVQWTYCLF